MANLTKSLTMPNGQEYEFVGKHWYGICTSSATAQTKSVTITGFASADFVNGTQITIQFSNAQNYSNTPFFININSLGARIIYESQGTYARQYEWKAGSVITFCYIGGSWYIIDGGHADTTYFGKTKLSNTIADDQTTALTPKAVYDAGYVNASGAAAAAPVQSVNGQTGSVVLGAGDVGALPDSTVIPTKTSDLTNDSGYLTLATLPIWDGGVE